MESAKVHKLTLEARKQDSSGHKRHARFRRGRFRRGRFRDRGQAEGLAVDVDRRVGHNMDFEVWKTPKSISLGMQLGAG